MKNSFVKRLLPLLGLAVAVVSVVAVAKNSPAGMLGRQPDGRYLVSTGQEILAGSIAFEGRPSDFAINPEQDIFAVQPTEPCSSPLPTGSRREP